MKGLKEIIIITIFIGAISACTYDEVVPKVDVPDSVSFALDVLPIFENNCAKAGCHVSGGIPPNLSADQAFVSLTFFGYVDTTTPENSKLYQKITFGTMKANATDQDRAIILKWIEQGALDN